MSINKNEKNYILSVVVLCYREEENIIPFIDKLKNLLDKLNIDWQIVLVGNYIEGSEDKTKEIVKKIAESNENIKAIVEPKKGMMGWDMRKGLESADGDYLCVIDGDGQFPINSIKKCFDIIKTGSYDLVKTYRKKRDDGLYRIFISKIYNFIFKFLFPGINFNDVNSKPKIITKKAYNKMKLNSDDWFIDAEIMIQARRFDFKIKEFPINFYSIKKRSSFVKITAIIEFIKNLIIYRIKEFFK